MLIESYDLQIDVTDHTTQDFDYEAIAHLTVDISEVLPLLNATQRTGTYFPDVPAFSWRMDDHKIGFWSDRIAADHLTSREQAKDLIDALVAMVNDLWERRNEIEPDRRRWDNLQPLELYKLLPKTNCKECGENSCFNFALKLAAGQVDLTACSPIFNDDGYAVQLGELKTLLETKRPLM